MLNQRTSLLTDQAAQATQRRTVLKQLGAVAAATLAPGMAMAQAAAKINMKIAISIPDSHPTTAALKAACAELLKESGGTFYNTNPMDFAQLLADPGNIGANLTAFIR